MDIYMIWAQEAGVKWLVEAWDDDTVAENDSGYEAALDKAYASYGAENVRVIKGRIDFGKVEAAFEVTDAGRLA